MVSFVLAGLLCNRAEIKQKNTLTSEGGTVGDALGSLLGCPLGFFEGDTLGNTVGCLLGTGVGLADGLTVGSQIS